MHQCFLFSSENDGKLSSKATSCSLAQGEKSMLMYGGTGLYTHRERQWKRKNQEGAEGCCRLTLSRHETQLFRSATPHETPRASADAHGERTLLHKSDTGGDADTQAVCEKREITLDDLLW